MRTNAHWFICIAGIPSGERLRCDGNHGFDDDRSATDSSGYSGEDGACGNAAGDFLDHEPARGDLARLIGAAPPPVREAERRDAHPAGGLENPVFS